MDAAKAAETAKAAGLHATDAAVERVDDVSRFYPVNMVLTHMNERIPPTLTVTKALLMYTVWNWLFIAVAYLTGSARLHLYVQSSSLLIACVIAFAWVMLGWPFFQNFYRLALRTDTHWVIVATDFVAHFAPVFLLGLPQRLQLPVAMPLLTFWLWYMAMRPHINRIYNDAQENVRLKTYDRVVVLGTVLWVSIVAYITMKK